MFLIILINNSFKFKRIKLGIVSSDYSTVYYDFTLGIDSPFEKEHYLKNKTNQ